MIMDLVMLFFFGMAFLCGTLILLFIVAVIFDWKIKNEVRKQTIAEIKKRDLDGREVKTIGKDQE